MGTTEILKGVLGSEMQWNGFVSEFALIDASVIQPVSVNEKKVETSAADSLIFL